VNNKISIGFLGGCINKQQGLPRQSHYYTHLASKLLNLEIDTTIKLGSYKSINTLPENLRQILNNNDLHMVGVFIRPFTVMPLCKPFIKYEDVLGKIKWGIHPNLMRKTNQWNSKLTDNYQVGHYTSANKKRFGIRDLNLLIGRVFGLHRWAESYIERVLSQLSILSKNKSVEIFLISPPSNPESFMGDYVGKRLTLKIHEYCSSNNIQLIDVSILDDRMFKPDKLHLNVYGHEHLSTLILEKVHSIVQTQIIL
jgi:hypothetical protein